MGAGAGVARPSVGNFPGGPSAPGGASQRSPVPPTDSLDCVQRFPFPFPVNPMDFRETETGGSGGDELVAVVCLDDATLTRHRGQSGAECGCAHLTGAA